MTITLYLFGRELFSITAGKTPAVEYEYETDLAEPAAKPETAHLMPAHGEFGFAAPAARDVDYPESRWDAQPYAHPESHAQTKDTAA